MLRALFLPISLVLTATSALAATDVETCRDNQAEAAARLTACTAVAADDKVTGTEGLCQWYIGDPVEEARPQRRDRRLQQGTRNRS